MSTHRTKSLGDLRTSVSTHGRSTPRQKGSTYLEVYLRDKERQRLEADLVWIAQRQRRVEARLAETREALEKLLAAESARGRTGGSPSSRLAAASQQHPAGQAAPPGGWRQMTIEY